MRFPLIVPLLLLVLGALLSWYVWERMRRCMHNRLPSTIFAIVAALMMCLPPAMLMMPVRDSSEMSLRAVSWLLFVYLTAMSALLLFTIFDLVARIPELWRKGHRFRWLTRTGAVLAIALYLIWWWGALINRLRISTIEVDVPVSGLSAVFDGTRIAQISDLHVGTFGSDTTFASRLVDHVNSLNPDIIVFTGDIVNRESSELIPFVETFSRLAAPMGVYSVMGNHDYGDYRNWPSEQARLDDIAALQRMEHRMGWQMLNNEHRTIFQGADSIVLIGVENVGDPPFHTYGSLDDAYPTLDDDAVKILLSHNPAHWAADIKDSPDKRLALTLSGHTHAMQIELGGISPAAWRYKYWGGLYQDQDEHTLYVNRGAGTVGMPARVGATPEITIITLRQK